MADQFARTRAMFGTQGMERLFHARVAVFGVGGVGGYAVEALARSGIFPDWSIPPGKKAIVHKPGVPTEG